MKMCDITMAYSATSGGIKTYIEEKRRYLRENTDHEHLLVIPGSRDRVRKSDRSTTVTIKSPLLPGQSGYRFFISPAKIKQVFLETQPDIIELGSYYTEPWAAFSYRRRRREAGLECVLAAYFHTDVAKAYVDAPLRTLAQNRLHEFSEALATGVDRIADFATVGAEKYMRYVFTHCDLALAASPSQAARLQEYGVNDVEIAPMGVDLKLFNPRRRSYELRTRLGADEQALVLMYAGRLCAEKRVLTLVKAFQLLPASLRAQLWMLGDGPQRPDIERIAAQDSAIRVFDYEGDRASLAEMLASADVYVSAGPFETFALSVIEAQACGLPIVGVDAGAMSERVVGGLGFLGPPDDAAVMAANIVRASSRRAIIGARAREHIARNFGWPSALARLVACYERKLAARHAEPAASQPDRGEAHINA